MGCPDITTDLSSEEAFSILEPYFEAVRAEFLSAGFSKCKQTRLQIDEAMHDTPRHFAACRTDGLMILLAPEFAEQQESFVLGIAAHEFGHAVDGLYPGEFVLGQDGKLVRRQQNEVSEKQWLRWMRAGRDRSGDVVEVTADRIAELVMGIPIGYSGPCLLQNFREGVERPAGLR